MSTPEPPAPVFVESAHSSDIPPTLRVWSGITWRVIVVIAGFAVAFFFIGLVATVFIALFLAAFFTALAGPIRDLLARFLPRVIALIGSIVLIALAVILVLFVVITSIINEGPALSKSVSSGFTQIQQWASGPPLNISSDDFSNYVSELQTWATNLAESTAVSTFGSLGDLVIGGSVFIFAVIFFMSSPRSIWNFVVSWMPKRAQNEINVSGELAWDSLSSYTRGVVVVALADATLVFIGLTILQVPLAPALAAIVFFGAFIPVIGAPIATFFAAIIALAERGLLVALLVVVLTVIVGSFDGDVLQPLVMGKAVSLHPLAIILLIGIGSITLGIIGALVAVPIGAAIYRVAKYLTNRDPERPRTSSPPTTDPTSTSTPPADAPPPASLPAG
jgi:putative heme transporter